MGNFTAITLDMDWTAKAVVNELYAARRERWIAAGLPGTAPADVAADEDAQAKSWAVNLQAFCEDNCGSFLDENQVIAGKSTPPMYTLSAFRYAAGLHADGFRRATTWPTDWTDPNDPAYLHGRALADDIIGPWILDDLQKALIWLKRVSRGPILCTGHSAGHENYCVGVPPPYSVIAEHAVCATARANHIAAWAAAGWYARDPSNYYEVGRWKTYSGSTYRFETWRLRSTAQLANTLAGTFQAYGLLVASGGSFLDLDAIGAAQNTLGLLGSGNLASPTTELLVGSYTANPLTLLTPYTCPFTGDEIQMCVVSNVYWILAPTFTYTAQP